MLEDQPDQTDQTRPADDGDRPVVKKTVRARTTRTVTPAASEAQPAADASTPAPAADASGDAAADAPATKAATRTTAKRTTTTRKTAARPTTKKSAAPDPGATTADDATPSADTPEPAATAKKSTAKAASKAGTRKRSTKAATSAPLFQAPDIATPTGSDEPAAGQERPDDDQAAAEKAPEKSTAKKSTAKKSAAKKSTAKKSTAKKSAATKSTATKTTAKQDAGDDAGDGSRDASPGGSAETGPTAAEDGSQAAGEDQEASQDGGTEDASDGETAPRRRRRRGGRRRRKSAGSGGSSAESDDDAQGQDADGADGADEGDDADEDQGGSSSRRRRKRRRAGEGQGGSSDDPDNTVTRVRQGRSPEDQITSLSGSTRLEAKKQRRREGREAGRRRAPIVSEAEFLARRESVDRTMVVRQRDDLTQIAVLEDKVLVEHYVARDSQTSLIGNVYLGRVQNVLPSMEAAFIDIGKGRNAVLYAGEVNWSALGHQEGQPRKIESVLSSGQSVLVQVTKDPVGHKGARLTSQISLAGRFLVYVPDGTTSGISRKLPDTERGRLKTLLKDIVPDTAGVIVRTAAEGATEDQLTRDVERLKARWEDIDTKAKGKAPQLLYGEPDLTLKVVRDLFTEDFTSLVIDGEDAWDTVHGYVAHVAPDLEERLERFEPATEGKKAGQDAFAAHRIDEQIHKGLDRKVWLPSGGSLIIDRTEAMTVVDVNTGKFTGSGGNLEETVTKNNLEAAEEIVRQLRLRDIGGIIVVDFIDMVLESNRDLVVRRLVECLGRDRTRHQVAEVTSLGLVQMTRKRIGTGLLEAFSHTCEQCQGRGVLVEDAPVEPSAREEGSQRSSRRGRGGRGRSGGSDNGSGDSGNGSNNGSNRGSGKGSDQSSTGQGSSSETPGDTTPSSSPSPRDVAAMTRKPAEDERPIEDGGSDVPHVDPSTEEPARPDHRDEADEPGQAGDSGPAGDETGQAATTVVRRTRRRASRPAGPPSGAVPADAQADAPTDAQPAPAPPAGEVTGEVAGVGTPPASGDVEPGTADLTPGETSEASAVAHVPVKRKGSRKR